MLLYFPKTTKRLGSVKMTFTSKIVAFVASVSLFLILLISLSLYIYIHLNTSLRPPVNRYLPSEPSKKSFKLPLTNPLRDLDVYVRFTTAIPDFPKQGEAWLFRSISLFWPKNTKVVVVLDKENARDRVYGSKIKKSALSKKITFKVCYTEAYPPEMIHHWGRMRMYMDMMHADLCTNAT